MPGRKAYARAACLALILAGCSGSSNEAPIRSQFGGTKPGVSPLVPGEHEESRRPVTTTPAKDPSSSPRSQFGGSASP